MTAGSVSLYSLHGLVQRFGDREVLNIPQLTLQSGAIYGLLGPNGAGKTTLMRILAFMDTPSSGSITFMGQKVRPEQAPKYRARVVWVPQSPVMFTGSLLYNIEYPMRLKKTPRAERREKAMALLDTVDLARLAKAPAHRLSGGEAQRASIARALAAGAEVILFDEPTASVDFRSRGEIIKLIRTLNRERGLSLIVTTHDAALAAELCKERIILFDGRVVPRYPRSAESALDDPYAPAPWPARLSIEDGIWRLALPPDAYATLHAGLDSPTHLEALSEEDGSISLRLTAGSGQTLSVVLHSPDELVLSRRLTLGSILTLSQDAP